MKEIIKAYNKIIAECNEGKSVAFSGNMVRENRIEDYRHHQFTLEKMCLSSVRCHILNESIFKNPDKLISDIMDRLENEEYEFTYAKIDLMKLMQGFNYESKFKTEVPSSFRLSVICTTKEEFYKRFGVSLREDSIAEEVLDPNDEWHEIIAMQVRRWRQRHGIIREYLKEELRHVWTYIFGMVDDNFYIGRTAFETEDILDSKKFNSYQREVLNDMYFGDLSLLQKDYDYIFEIQDGNAENWELSVHVDTIIDMLIDYYDGSKPTEKYLSGILNDAKSNRISRDDRMLHDFYENSDPSFKPMKDNIRRLFMLYAFGNEKQIEYFEKECKKEFGEDK